MAFTPYSRKIQLDLIKLLYRQIKFALWAETIAAICYVAAMWGAVESHLLTIWLCFNLMVCGIGRHALVIAFKKTTSRLKYNYDKLQIWLYLFALGAFLSGVSWGAIGSLLMVKNDLLRQTFAIFLLIGVTAAANPFYSPIRKIYALFLIPAFVPFAIWLFLQGGIFILLGLLAIIYIIIMLATSFYSHKLISTSLALSFENTDLVENLYQAKIALEHRTAELEKSLGLVRATLEATSNGILVVTSENKIEDFNNKFAEMWRIKTSDIRHSNIHVLYEQILPQLENPKLFTEKMNTEEEETFDEVFFKDGRIFERYSYPQCVGNKTVGRVWSFRDVTTRKTLEAKLFQQANYDSLTGLPNRALLLDRVDQAIHYAKTFNKDLAILFADLDRFKLINDSLGHALGDLLLVEVAKRLKNAISPHDTVSREGGDEFVIILNGLANENETVSIASDILNAIREPFLIEGYKLNITISIGISFFPKDSVEGEMLIRKADIAMYHAKELGRNNFQFFTEEMNKKVLKRLVIENQLRDALAQNELTLLYQPIVSLHSGKIVGLEALLRWQHPSRVNVPTIEFITVAEESGLIIPIGKWVIETACQHIKNLHLKGFDYLQMAVNLSGRQFKQSNFTEQISDILLRSQLDPRYLALELTESVIMDDLDKTIISLKKMKQMGMTIVIDDFGTGYSSLNYLKRLPVDKLKIDRSFIADLPHHIDDAAITSAIIALAGKLNLKVVAEGVEKENQVAFLIKHKCDEMQGFFFSEPLTADDCLNVLESNLRKPLTIVGSVSS